MTACDDINGALGNLGNSASSINGKLDQILANQTIIINRLDNLDNRFNLLENRITQLESRIDELQNSLTDIIIASTNAVRDVLLGVLNTIQNILQGLFDLISNLFGGNNNDRTNEILAAIENARAQNIEVTIDTAQVVINSVRAAIDECCNLLINAIQNLVQDDRTNEILDRITQLQDSIKAEIDENETKIDYLPEKIKEFIDSSEERIKEKIAEIDCNDNDGISLAELLTAIATVAATIGSILALGNNINAKLDLIRNDILDCCNQLGLQISGIFFNEQNILAAISSSTTATATAISGVNQNVIQVQSIAEADLNLTQSLDASVDSLTSTINQLNNEINNIENAIQNISNIFNNISGTVNNINNIVNNIDSNINQIIGDINNIDNSILQIGDSLEPLNQTIIGSIQCSDSTEISFSGTNFSIVPAILYALLDWLRCELLKPVSGQLICDGVDEPIEYSGIIANLSPSVVNAITAYIDCSIGDSNCVSDYRTYKEVYPYDFHLSIDWYDVEKPSTRYPDNLVAGIDPNLEWGTLWENEIKDFSFIKGNTHGYVPVRNYSTPVFSGNFQSPAEAIRVSEFFTQYLGSATSALLLDDLVRVTTGAKKINIIERTLKIQRFLVINTTTNDVLFCFRNKVPKQITP